MQSTEQIERTLTAARRAWRLFTLVVLLLAFAIAALQVVPARSLAPLERSLSRPAGP